VTPHRGIAFPKRGHNWLGEFVHGGFHLFVAATLLADLRLVDAATYDGFARVAVFLSTDDALGQESAAFLVAADVAGFHRLCWYFDFHIGITSRVRSIACCSFISIYESAWLNHR
jgi:hypothetical protein